MKSLWVDAGDLAKLCLCYLINCQVPVNDVLAHAMIAASLTSARFSHHSALLQKNGVPFQLHLVAVVQVVGFPLYLYITTSLFLIVEVL